MGRRRGHYLQSLPVDMRAAPHVMSACPTGSAWTVPMPGVVRTCRLAGAAHGGHNRHLRPGCLPGGTQRPGARGRAPDLPAALARLVAARGQPGSGRADAACAGAGCAGPGASAAGGRASCLPLSSCSPVFTTTEGPAACLSCKSITFFAPISPLSAASIWMTRSCCQPSIHACMRSCSRTTSARGC